jgi:hypothetical protein
VALDDAAFITLTAGAAASPDAPTSLAATPGVRSVTLTWNVPSDDGGATITDYVVEFSDDGTNFSTFADGTSTSTRATVTALTDGTEYTLRVSAVNSAGTGSASSTVTVTPGVPGEPTAFAASDGADGTAVLSWSAPTTGGSGVTGYRVSYSTDSGATWSAEVAADSATGHVFTLADGTYEVRVRAVNAAGFGAYSSASVSVTGT